MDDLDAVLLTDILPTAWHATEMGEVGPGDVVAIWGAGPGGGSTMGTVPVQYSVAQCSTAMQQYFWYHQCRLYSRLGPYCQGTCRTCIAQMLAMPCHASYMI
jgi:hypothetical protein